MSTVHKKRAEKAPADRRQEILQAALELFAERGYGETTVGEIAARATMAPGTVYLYFPSKDHILLALHEHESELIGAQVGEVVSEVLQRRGRGEDVDYRQAIDTIIDAIADYCQANQALVEVCIKSLPGSQLAAEAFGVKSILVSFVATALEQASREGVIHTSDPEMTAHLLIAAVRNTIGSSIAYGDPADLNRLVAAVKELHYKALAPPSS